jgi:mannose-6-phosphate isomerase-like protein (cupin superfamily)
MNDFLAETAAILCGLDHSMARRVGAKLAPIAETGIGSNYREVPALQHIEAATQSAGAHPMMRSAAGIAGLLPWEEVDPDLVPAHLVGRHAFCEIVGPDGLVAADDFRLGFFISSPEVLYPSHSHEAEEIFFVLSGTAEWLQADGAFRPVPPGALIHHVPRQRHGTRTGPEPLFVIWAWQGDLGFESYRFHVDDD